jgi:hypothetical protein
MYKDIMFDLQLFADGAPAGEGASASGVDSADPGQAILEGLGVPADRAAKWANSKVRREMPAAAQRQETAAAQTEQGDPSPASSKASFDEILKDPEYKQAFDNQVQGLMHRRLSKMAPAKEAMDTMRDAHEALAFKYGLDPSAADFHKALAAAVMADDSTLERFADERGTSIETARADFAEKQELARLRAKDHTAITQQSAQQHFNILQQQAQEVLKHNPNFNILEEINTNEMFAKLTSPMAQQLGITVADAYMLAHRDEILMARDDAQAQKTMEAVTNNVRAGQNRPRENGASMPSSMAPADYSKLSREKQLEVIKELKRRAAMGEKPKPSMLLR